MEVIVKYGKTLIELNRKIISGEANNAEIVQFWERINHLKQVNKAQQRDEIIL